MADYDCHECGAKTYYLGPVRFSLGIDCFRRDLWWENLLVRLRPRKRPEPAWHPSIWSPATVEDVAFASAIRTAVDGAYACDIKDMGNTISIPNIASFSKDAD